MWNAITQYNWVHIFAFNSVQQTFAKTASITGTMPDTGSGENMIQFPLQDNS